MSGKAGSALGRFIDEIEETFIAFILASMTLITFANVIARYILNSNILWAKDATVFLLAWLVLIGASYGVKKSIHIGVDIVVNNVPPLIRRLLLLIAVTCCLAFSILLLIGSWNYWLPFVTERAWYTTEDIPMPSFLQFLSVWLNEGEKYEKMPAFIPYAVLPLSMALLVFRYLQITWTVITGKTNSIIASHEVEELIEETKKMSGDK